MSRTLYKLRKIKLINIIYPMKFLKRLSRSDKDINSRLEFPYSVEDHNNNNVLDQLQFVYTPVLRIQQAWRRYRESQLVSTDDTPQPDFQCFKNPINYCTSSSVYNRFQQYHKEQLDNRLYYSQDIRNNNVDYNYNEMSTDSPLRFSNKNYLKNLSSSNSSSQFQIESDPNSFASDYSEVNDTLKDQLANVHILSNDSLTYISSNNESLISVHQKNLDNNINNLHQKPQENSEDDINIQKQVRKTNLLSLAQEFAALKKMNSYALPFDLHHDRYKDLNSLSDTASEPDDAAMSDATMTTASNVSINHNATPGIQSTKSLPFSNFYDDSNEYVKNVNDEYVASTNNDENNTVNNVPDVVKSQLSNREEIRKKLAFKLDEDESNEQTSGLFYLNETATDLDNVKDKCETISSRPDIIPSIMSTSDDSITRSKQHDEDFFSKQARLQTEAKMALAQVRPMAHMQLQLEKQKVTKSPLADIVGMPGYCDGKQIHLNVQLMNNMNIAQLQVVVNDLHARIEELNIELMQQLVSRDDLHMAQDSMLIDIEDLTGRAQEFAARVNKKIESSKYI
ncbi:hypothetical protein HELRODRAFT_188645 [Helobdella robusta]|uniref:Schwannomin interacting protein 1 C-terminal domain-containing protein n=1 Tax=Helobdella robusta TaxID=6412 RepID=T1FQ77_HELRO|nr:hypothetical protein HELRODRAFT_188645 [Helobdella robusta]ESO02272.1 hypothetical protein HELRODRAFT_188645 [Helobdella robusta]